MCPVTFGKYGAGYSVNHAFFSLRPSISTSTTFAELLRVCWVYRAPGVGRCSGLKGWAQRNPPSLFLPLILYFTFYCGQIPMMIKSPNAVFSLDKYAGADQVSFLTDSVAAKKALEDAVSTVVNTKHD